MSITGNTSLNRDPRLTVIFAALIVLILGGNALVILQFQTFRNETNRLTGTNQQLVAVLQLQADLLSFHRRLDDLARSMDLHRLLTETPSLRGTLREQTYRTRTAISSLPPGTIVDSSFLPTLDTIDATLPAEIEAIVDLGESGDWGEIRPRVDNELNPIETQTAILVNTINQQASGELVRDLAEMSSVQRRILVIVPAVALCTFFMAALFGWSIARRFIELRLEERVGERLRIARELHDTLLQSFNALLLRLQTVSNVLPANADEAKRRIDRAMQQGSEAITEVRDAVQDLRSGAVAAIDLDQAIGSFAKELRSGSTAETAPEILIEVQGKPGLLNPEARDEVFRIAAEALRNAIRHAQARRIEVEIRYDEDQLRLRIVDDGKGIDPVILGEGSSPGHWGLHGMQERAKLIGGTMEVWSQTAVGTELVLKIPAANIYAKLPFARWPVSSRFRRG